MTATLHRLNTHHLPLLTALAESDVDAVLDIGLFPDDLHGPWTELSLHLLTLELLTRSRIRLKLSVYISPEEVNLSAEPHVLQA